ncbi:MULTISPECIES: TRAP transporter substrate-binding protein [unclassified Bradyrhizobium]|uniref:TRAP transporter substrate-binding protein n=1 Tax=unclassified Bradyrhizobium TaxID=2631580 RepID=UPI00143D5422|nr:MULTISPECIES: TRAP transporter substrate-binding protein [unclassified Bradyrhizobium]
MKTTDLTRRGLLGAASATWATTILRQPAKAAAEFDFKLGVNTPETHPLTIRLTEAAKAIGAQSAGRLNVTVFSNSQLGGDPEMLSQVRAGGIELLAVPSLTLSILVPMSGLPSIGFAFQSYDQVWAAMDGGVGEVVRDAIGKAGIVPMKKVWDNGFRQITSSSSRQLNSVDDLKGFKIRVPVTALLTSLFSGLGALPSSISYNELYSALQTHIVEGQENPLAQVSTGKLYEVQKYCALSNHCWSGYWIVANRSALTGLPADLQEIVSSNFDAAGIKERADLLEMDRSLQAELTAKGMTFNTPDPVQFRAALVKAGFYTQWQKTYGEQAWAQLEKYTGKLT